MPPDRGSIYQIHTYLAVATSARPLRSMDSPFTYQARFHRFQGLVLPNNPVTTAVFAGAAAATAKRISPETYGMLQFHYFHRSVSRI